MSRRPPAPDLFAPHGESALLEGLNPEQLAAVTHGEGPLLILAGPGTGKTHVITRRLAWLMTTGRARPEAVLGLTFTDKAAAEMETRVDEWVPYGLTGATTSTFHAFCDRLVREHAVELGLTSRLRVEQPAEILVFLRERIFELGLARYLPLGDPDAHLAALVHVFDRARDEDVSPERYLAFAEQLARDAGDDPERRDRAEAELEKARAYAAYQQLLAQHGRVDFGSQISLALRLLRERPHTRRQVQERWRWILVDEFQDTNHVQFELVRLLAGERRNVTVVGDDDQSIYRFRGAKVENLLGFASAFPDHRVVRLQRNYRSGQGILDLAHRAIQFNNPARLEAVDPERYDKRLVSVAGAAAEVEHHEYETGGEEADAVAADILAHAGAGGWRACAILARTHGHLEAFAQSLRARGIPFQRRSARGLYQRPEILLCLNALRVLADPADGAALHALLADPLFGVDPARLAALTADAMRRNVPPGDALRRALAAPDPAGPEGPRAALARVVALLDGLEPLAARRPTSEVLYAFVTESGLLATLSQDESAEALERVQNLNKLFGIVQRVGPLLRSDRVAFFISHLEQLIEAGDDPQAFVADTEEDAVQLLTAHNAKGLEFDAVYLVNLVEGRFPTQRRGDALPFPPELAHGHGDPALDHAREERRLFYVGLTRARRRLVLTHARDYGGKRTARMSPFVAEALALAAPPKRRRKPSAEEAIQRFAPAADPPGVARAAPDPDAPLHLSHGQIDSVLACPLQYRFAHVVQVPVPTDARTMYGIAMHHAIRVYFQHRLRGVPITPEDVIGAFDEAWSPEGFLSREHEELRLREGRESLRRLVAAEERSGRLPLAVEAEFRFRVDGDVVRGRWDRIDETPDGIVLVDYKTGEVGDAEQAHARARRSLQSEQLGLYALAHQETREVAPVRVQLRFVGSGLTGEAEVEPEHLERARERVRTAAREIRTGEFPARPDARTCGYCAYARVCAHRATGRA